MSKLRRAIEQKLDGMATEQGITESPVVRDFRGVEPRTYGRVIQGTPSRRDEWRISSARKAAEVPRATVPVPKEARDLEGRYGDAPDEFNRRTGVGPATVRICIIAVEWHKRLGSSEQVLRVTGRDTRTKNIVICPLADVSNVGDTP